MISESMTRKAHSAAADRPGMLPMIIFPAAGRGWSLRFTSARMPSVPNEPIYSLFRS